LSIKYALYLLRTDNNCSIIFIREYNRIFDVIANNPFYGENAKKDLIPREYRQKYDADNLFIVDLPDYWRMIYTLESDEIEIIAFVLDIIDHNQYNKKFGFRKR